MRGYIGLYKQTRGSIPGRAQVNHLCDRPYCCQPSHLYAGTHQGNSDDARLFRSDGIGYGLVGHGDPYRGDNPLLQRLSENPRYLGVVPWNPVEHPPQIAWDAFRCCHDFSIPQQDGQQLWCRICDETPSTIQSDEQFRDPSLIASLWPISQTVAPIRDAIYGSAVLGVGLLARREGLDDPGHVREMERHLAQCSAQQLADGRIQIERMLGGATYAALHNDPEEDVAGQLWFQMVDRRVSRGYVTKDIPDIVRALTPELPEAASRLIDRWREQLIDASDGRVVPSKLRAADLIFHSAYWGVVWILLDQARHDLTGTTSTGQRWPPPHDYCIEQVRTTGRWEDLSLPDPFEEGREYRADDDVNAMGSRGFTIRSQRTSGGAMPREPCEVRTGAILRESNGRRNE